MEGMSEFLRAHDLRRGAIEFVPDFEMKMTTGGMRSVGGESRYDVTDCHAWPLRSPPQAASSGTDARFGDI